MNAPVVPMLERDGVFHDMVEVDAWLLLEEEAARRGTRLLERGWKAPTALISAAWKAFQEVQRERRAALARWKELSAEVRAAELGRDAAEVELARVLAAIDSAGEATARGVDRLDRALGLKDAIDSADPRARVLEEAANGFLRAELAHRMAIDALEKHDDAFQEVRERWARAWDAVELAARPHAGLYRTLFAQAGVALDRKGIPALVPLFLLEPIRRAVRAIHSKFLAASTATKATVLAAGAAVSVASMAAVPLGVAHLAARAAHSVHASNGAGTGR